MKMKKIGLSILLSAFVFAVGIQTYTKHESREPDLHESLILGSELHLEKEFKSPAHRPVDLLIYVPRLSEHDPACGGIGGDARFTIKGSLSLGSSVGPEQKIEVTALRAASWSGEECGLYVGTLGKAPANEKMPLKIAFTHIDPRLQGRSVEIRAELPDSRYDKFLFFHLLSLAVVGFSLLVGGALYIAGTRRERRRI